MKLPPYENFPIISDDNILLRQIQFSEINNLIEISFYDAIQATTFEEAIEMQTKIHKDYSDGNSIHWGIVIKLTNKILGTCGYSKTMYLQNH